MTLEELVDLGERMRRAQKAYFDHRHQSDLVRSKELERAFDKAIEEHRKGAGLFDP